MAEDFSVSQFPDPPPSPQPDGPEEAISWTASEFIAHEKSIGWYVMLSLVTLVLSVVVWLIAKDVVSIGVIVICAVVLGIYGSRPPRQLQYQLDAAGLTIERKFYGYTDFRSYAVVPEGGLTGIEFMPMKRFLPALTIYFDPRDEAKILAMLSPRLPLAPHHRDAVDRLLIRMRF